MSRRSFPYVDLSAVRIFCNAGNQPRPNRIHKYVFYEFVGSLVVSNYPVVKTRLLAHRHPVLCAFKRNGSFQRSDNCLEISSCLPRF